MRKVKVRGLARLAAGLFAVWGGLVAPKGLYDLCLGQPEANLYSPQPWQFVTRAQWQRYAAFELLYGAACLGLAVYLWRYARFLPEWVERDGAET
ncbi:MAG: hypothetical protein HY928_15480 [Elusimicrobia bacterium]|nr:hypothetical protein [Elusimicrobiota bacterium]